MPEQNHLPSLDGWRGAAIACLLLGHFFPIEGINLGRVGVNLFFVLSGFLMTRILFVQRVPLKQFYLRRIARIIPSVMVFLATIAAVFALTGRQISTLEFWSAATFTNNYFQPLGQWTMPLGHIWSLSVEEHAYVALSFLALLARTGRGRSLAAVGAATIAIAAVACSYALAQDPTLLSRRWLHTEVAAFGIFASSLVFLSGLRIRHGVLVLAAVPLLLLAGLAAHWWSVPKLLQLLVGGSAFALAINLLPQAPAPLVRVFAFLPLRQLGIWSFSLYLWQQPFYQLVSFSGMHPFTGLGLSLGTGICAYYLVEKPARSYLNRRWAAPQPGQRTPGAASGNPTGAA